MPSFRLFHRSPLGPLLRLTTLSAAVLTLASCASVAPVSLSDAASALKVGHAAAIEVTGTGQWFQFGQAPAPGTAWPAFAVSRFVASYDYRASAARVQITRRQVVEAGRERPAPVDQSVDQYVAGAHAWNRPVGANAANAAAQPAAVAERAADLWSTPQGFLQAALANQALTRTTSAGTEVSFTTADKAHYVGLLNARGQVDSIKTWIDTPVLGDTLLETRFSDYKDYGGLPFPTRIARSEGGYPILDLQVSDVKPGGTVPAAPPEVVSFKPPALTVTSTRLADGVYYLTGGTHHSVLIEQRDHLVLVEAPLNEERSLALIAKAREIAPTKAIRYLVNTHAHFDHSGGLRTFVDAGATIVTQKSNRAYYEQVWAAPRTLGPDRLAASSRSPVFETFTGKHVLTDGQRSIELHEVAGNGHNDAFALVYLPREKVLVEADAYTPGAANAPVPTPLNPYTVNLYDNIQKLQLDVTQIAALHGPRVTTLADLRAASGRL